MSESHPPNTTADDLDDFDDLHLSFVIKKRNVLITLVLSLVLQYMLLRLFTTSAIILQGAFLSVALLILGPPLCTVLLGLALRSKDRGLAQGTFIATFLYPLVYAFTFFV